MKQRTINNITKYGILFFIGAIVYMGMEIGWRNYTDLSMGIVGGIAFIIIGLLNEPMHNKPLLPQMFLGSAIITTLELISGIILNIWLKLNIWDYSDMPFNFLGQICLGASLLWFLISLIAIVLDDFVRWLLFGEEFPRYKWI